MVMKQMKGVHILLVVCLLVLICLYGCAKMKNEIASDGGFFGSYAGDYIVRNDSGGVIMDMWKLKNVIVQSVTSSDGWLFRDEAGNVINLGGDVKVVRVNDSVTWDKYHEYHAEFNTKSYQELYAVK